MHISVKVSSFLLVIATFFVVSNLILLLVDETTAQIEFSKFEDIKEGIMIEYPRDWRVSTGGDDYTTIATFNSPLTNLSDMFSENLEMSVIQFSENITLEDYNKRAAMGIGATPDLNITNSTAVKLADNQGYKIIASPQINNNTEFAFENEDLESGFTFMRVWTVQDNKVYTLLFSAESDSFDSYLPVINKMIDSFRIK